jgi:hypothetical protein
MKSESHIVQGGGWVTTLSVGRPRARFFGFLSVIWRFDLRSFPFWHGSPKSFGYWESLCGALLVPQPVFIIVSAILSLTEQPRTITEQKPHDYGSGSSFC